MASLVLGLAGAAIGPSIFGAGFTLFGAAISGAQIGGFIGATIGQAIDAQLFSTTVKQQGPRLKDVQITASTEGAAIPRAYGRVRLAGQLIWATRFREEVKKTKSSAGGGKGGGGTKVETTEYRYYCSFAVGLCAGPVHGLGRIWADGKILPLDGVKLRFHPGTEDQAADAKITAVEGAANAPAYRGLAYVVFEDLFLGDFGNRLPQIQIELWRAIGQGKAGTLEEETRAVTLIPASGEFAYGTAAVSAGGKGSTDYKNVSA